MFREPLAGAVPLSLEPLQTTDAHAYWQTFVSGRTDLPTSDLKVHLDRYLALPPEEQRSNFSVKRDGRIIGTVRLGPAEISGFSMDPTSREERSEERRVGKECRARGGLGAGSKEGTQS